MSMFKAFAFIAPLTLGAAAVATAALAQPARFSDAQYIAAARCEGLMASPALGREDTRDIDQVLKIQSSARPSVVFDRADQAKENALQAARHGGPDNRAALIAERDGACRVLTGAGAMASTSGPAGASRSN